MKRIETITSIIVLFISATLVLTGCNKDESLDNTGDNRMQFDIIHPDQQKTNSRVTSTSFESSDIIGLYITEAKTPLQVSGNYENNVRMVYNGTAWETIIPVYWDKGQYDVFAYYPYSASPSSVDDYPFEVQADQTTIRNTSILGGYEASDFLWASRKELSASTSPVSLQFKHLMSRLVIRLVKGDDYEGELPENAVVRIHHTVPTATIDISTGFATKNPYGTTKTITAKALNNHQYAAILIPQRITNRCPLIEVTMNDVSYLMESTFIFKQGMQHTVSLVISKNPEQVKIEIGGEIDKWE